GDARIELAEAESGPEIDSQVVQRASGRRQWFAWISFAVVTVVAAVAVLAYFRAVPPAPEMRFEISVPPTTSPPSLAISPDGQRIVYAASSDGQTRLWLRSLDSVAARPLRETDFASYPFWSPDGRSIGFFADGKLKRIDIDGGSAQTLANAAGGLGGTWNQDGTILFAPSGARPIYRVPATGGEPFAVTSIATPHQTAHRSPQFLPDGRHFLYYAMGTAEGRGVYVSRIDGAQGRRLTDADWGAVLASSGQLFFIRNTTLFAQDFDSDRLVLTGSPYPVAEQMSVNSQNAAGVSASMVGPIVYRSGSRSGQRQLAWFDRSGKEIVKIGASVDSAWRPSLSPNGRRVALTLTVNGNTDIWLAETTKGVLSRFTFAATGEYLPIWSPDGTRIIFNSNRNGPFDFYQKAATGAGSEELVLATLQSKSATDWSSDGRFLLYRNLDDKLGYDLWALPLLGDRKPFPVVQTDYDERDGQFSPDGKWIAYQSNESGRFEIYVQPFPGPGSKWQVSTNGGAQVRWRRDGRELFYIALDDRLMAAPLRFVSNGQAVETDAPVPLFATRVGGAEQSNFGQQYNVSPDGQRFLMNTVVEEAYSFPITVILNWKPKT
ncbi:MAG: PD40 domain-containing protein, partial [Acidobacteria bacterium]|nr:PD40 domain-containing protein [Acidobacteriota bacterium]